jgi:hypothetical protein
LSTFALAFGRAPKAREHVDKLSSGPCADKACFGFAKYPGWIC